MSHDAELRHLIARLARDHDLPVTRHGHLIGHRRQKPLLAILAETSTPSSGSAAGRGTVGPRIAFDPTASELHATIHARIRDWALAAHVPRGAYFVTGDQLDWTDTAQLLLAWHSATSDTDPLTWIPTLTSWVVLITDLVIDPPKRITLDAPCPRCGHRWAILGGRDSSRVDALQITLRDPATDSETDCRACGARWAGLDGADALKEEFHQLAHLEHALHCAGTAAEPAFEPWIQPAIDASRARLAAQQLQERAAS